MKILNSKNGLGKIIVNTAKETSFEVRFDYLGRGMNGKKCFGLVGSFGFSNIADFFIMLTKKCLEDDYDIFEISTIFKDFKTDDMGLDTIIYFPNLRICWI